MHSESKNSSAANTLRSEVTRYIIFGLLTTVVSLISNFAVLWGGRAALGITEGDSAEYLALFTGAKVFSWVCAVLFAFFTNKKWVFRDEAKGGADTFRQLIVFSGGRLVTLGLDWVLNIAFLWCANALSLTFLDGLFGLSLTKINELGAWGLTQVFVVASNYFFSKWLVFRKPAEK